MPNWCSTRFIFRGETPDIRTLHDKIREWTGRSFTVTDFGDPWLGNILYGAGLANRIDCHDENAALSCRGTLEDIAEITECKNQTGYSEFFVYTETAWAPMGRMWQAVIEMLKLDSIHFGFTAEELGNGLYQKYDPHGLLADEGKEWLLDLDVLGEPGLQDRVTDDPNGVFYFTEQGLRSELQKMLNTDEADITKLVDAAENYPFISDLSYIVAVHVEILSELRD